MRKVVVSEFVSLDGVIEEPSWTFQFSSEEQQKFKFDELFASDALLLGRVTYEGFADRMNSLPKVVVSATLEEPLEWNNSRLIKGRSRGRSIQAEAAARSGHLDLGQWRARAHADATRPHR